MQERKLRLKTDKLQFNRLAFDWKAKAAVFTWYADTEVPNIALVRIVVVRLGWPPVKVETCFTDAQ